MGAGTIIIGATVLIGAAVGGYYLYTKGYLTSDSTSSFEMSDNGVVGPAPFVISSGSADSSSACAKQCLANDTCKMFHYNKDGKTCDLMKPKDDGVWMTSVKLANGSYVDWNNTDLPGYDIGTVQTKDTLDGCKAACTGDSTCKWAQYNSSGKQCFIKKPTYKAGDSVGFRK